MLPLAAIVLLTPTLPAPPMALMAPVGFASPAGAAAAIPTGDREATSTTDFDGPPRTRSGIAIGLHLGVALGSASGYPNNSQDIGNPADHSSSGPLFGTTQTLTIMGALSDYLNFGFWFGSVRYKTGSWESSGGGLGLRVEGFPLLNVFPFLSGLGLMGQFGVGAAGLQSTNPAVPHALGVQSFAAGGVFYEWEEGKLLGGHFGVGPSLQYEAMWSLPFEQHGLVATARIVFYGGP